MPCAIQKPSGAISGWTTEREVKNLGWILRHWMEVSRIVVDIRDDIGPVSSGAMVFFYLRDGRRYVTDYASRSVLRHFLDRPVFCGLPVYWGSETPMTIGGPEYRAMRESWEKS